MQAVADNMHQMDESLLANAMGYMKQASDDRIDGTQPLPCRPLLGCERVQAKTQQLQRSTALLEHGTHWCHTLFGHALRLVTAHRQHGLSTASILDQLQPVLPSASAVTVPRLQGV